MLDAFVMYVQYGGMQYQIAVVAPDIKVLFVVAYIH